MNPKLPIWRAEESIYLRRVQFLVTQEGPQGRAVGQPTDIMMSFGHDETCVMEPTLSIHLDEAQQIINELWRLGFRPKDGSGALAHTDAISAHLADMRTIAFNRLKIES